MYYELKKNYQVIKTYKKRGNAERRIKLMQKKGQIKEHDLITINFILDLY